MNNQKKQDILRRNREKNAKKRVVVKDYSKHRENVLERQRRNSAKRRAKLKNNLHEFYTKDQILSTYGSLCHICKKEIDLQAPRNPKEGGNWHFGLQIDHLIPISKGGPDILDNVRPAHAQCNIRKSDN